MLLFSYFFSLSIRYLCIYNVYSRLNYIMLLCINTARVSYHWTWCRPITEDGIFSLLSLYILLHKQELGIRIQFFYMHFPLDTDG